MNLRNAMYDADDLFDEYKTIAQQLNGMPGGKLSKKVRRFFSSKNPLLFAYKKSVEVNKLREKLDKIAKDHRDFGFSKLHKKLAVKTREETCSYVFEQVIIGRDADKETIVDLLLNDDLENNISFVTVVGIGGLGKTALAQLVFSDHRIKEAFKDGMYWVCVSFNFDTKDILSKILKEEQRTFEDLYCNVREQIEGKRYMLVLDDVWYEGGIKWDELRDFLNLGGKGSRILVTSRSQKVATAIGNYPMHKLQGLSEKDSWELFRKISLGVKEDEAIAGFDEIGRDIVKKCANVPLSIRVVASLLRGQDINAWQSYRRIDLAKMHDDEDDYLMPTLMFSYYHLDPALKTCFSFCSVFPQDYDIDKEVLINLWSAHGYLVPSGTDNSMEDTGERYFSILLNRCFFQDVQKKEYSDEVQSVKMHDLIHDLARKIAGKESLTLSTCCTREFEGNARHLFIDSEECMANWSSSSNCTSKTLRTLFKNIRAVSYVGIWSSIISKCSRLRVLSIHYYSFYYRFALGELLHLRYLDLTDNCMEMLPKSITNLHNLQTLNLVDCVRLKELPEDTWKLVNLRVLHMNGCKRLTHLPKDTSKLVNLRVLHINRCESFTHMPKDTSKLVNLRELHMNGCKSLTHLSEDTSKLVNLRELHMNGCKSLTHLPEDTSKLVNLRVLSINGCESLTHMPAGMGNLTSLHTLTMSIVCGDDDYLIELKPVINNLRGVLRFKEFGDDKRNICMEVKLDSFNIEYGIDRDQKVQKKLLEIIFSNSQSEMLSIKYYNGTILPSWASGLVSIRLSDCKELLHLPSSLSQLCHLKYLFLRELTSMEYIESDADAPSPSAKFFPCLEELQLINMPKLKGWWKNKTWMEKEIVSIPSFPRLYKLNIWDCESLTYIPQCPHLKELGLSSLRSLLTEGFQICASLQNLKIYNCWGIENLRIEHLTNLNFLKITALYQIESFLEEMCHLPSLTTLIISCRQLPEAIKHLTSLTTLEINYCRKLKSLPEAIKHLTSLNTLTILGPSPELKDRCHKSDGEDWLKICHIPNIYISTHRHN